MYYGGDRQRFPPHGVAARLGNTVKFADAQYNQVTYEHFRRATGPELKEEPSLPQVRLRQMLLERLLDRLVIYAGDGDDLGG